MIFHGRYQRATECPRAWLSSRLPTRPKARSILWTLDSEPTFKSGDYRALAERISNDVVWDEDEGQGEIAGQVASLTATDACLFISFDGDVATSVVQSLTAQMRELGAVVLDADSADTL